MRGTRSVLGDLGLGVAVLDRFHVLVHSGKAINEVRLTETRERRVRGYEAALTRRAD